MQRVVIYTPQEDFWYNSVLGANLLSWFMIILLSAFIGFTASALLLPRNERLQKVIGTILTIASAGLFHLALVSL